jgi:hypothetical protein
MQTARARVPVTHFESALQLGGTQARQDRRYDLPKTIVELMFDQIKKAG